jgi:hypothetical protein
VNTNFTQMGAHRYEAGTPDPAPRPVDDVLLINHYVVRSLDEFRFKMARGSALTTGCAGGQACRRPTRRPRAPGRAGSRHRWGLRRQGTWGACVWRPLCRAVLLVATQPRRTLDGHHPCGRVTRRKTMPFFDLVESQSTAKCTYAVHLGERARRQLELLQRTPA